MMYLLTRVTGSGAGSCEAALFNGLRVRMVGSARGGGEEKGERFGAPVESVGVFTPYGEGI
jgi:hypothetical protein